jgi:hypothetical protein
MTPPCEQVAPLCAVTVTFAVRCVESKIHACVDHRKIVLSLQQTKIISGDVSYPGTATRSKITI